MNEDRRNHAHLAKIYRDGYQAQRAGVLSGENPYEARHPLHRKPVEESDEAHAWRQGWSCAYTTYLEADRGEVDHRRGK